MASRLKSPSGTRAGRRNEPLSDATRMAKALAHPLRARLLATLNERQASPNELAKLHGEPLGTVSYHVRILADLDCVELVDTARRRGAIESYYRATQRALLEDAEWMELPVSARRGFAADTIKRAVADMAAALETGGLDEEETHISYTPLELDERGRRRLAKNLQRAFEQAIEDQARTLAAGDAAKGVQRRRLFIGSYKAASTET